MFGKKSGVKKNPALKLRRMNAACVRPEPKLLADVAARFNASGNILPEHSGPDSLYSIEEIHVRAETMTPLLKEILDFHPPEHWEINE